MSAAPATAGLDENIAGLLSYLFSWISGLVFLLIDKRPFVRFHAAQSIALTIASVVIVIAFWIVTLILGIVTTMLNFPIGWLTVLLFPLVMLAIFAAFVYSMYKAFKHEKYKLPIIGDMVEKMVG